MRHIQVNLWQLVVYTLEALWITHGPINSLTNNSAHSTKNIANSTLNTVQCEALNYVEFNY